MTKPLQVRLATDRMALLDACIKQAYDRVDSLVLVGELLGLCPNGDNSPVLAHIAGMIAHT